MDGRIPNIRSDLHQRMGYRLKMGRDDRPNRWYQLFFGLVVFSILGSLAERLLGADPGLIKPIAGAATLCSGVLALLTQISRDESASKAIKAFLGLVFIGAGSEILGIYTGLPFGKYAYTDAWAPVVVLPGGHFFPVLLPLAWVMMVASGYAITARVLSGFWAIFLCALLATLADLPLEFAVIHSLKYWTWLDPSWPIGDVGFGVPILNSVGWFGTSFLGAMVLSRFAPPSESSRNIAVRVLGSLTLLMVALSLIAQLPVLKR